MTTLTQEQTHNKPAKKAGFILLLGILVVSILITFRDIPSSTVATVKPIPEIKYQPHAVEKHGSDALAIRKCLNDKGARMKSGEASIRRPFICGATCQMIVGDLWQLCRMPLTASGMKVLLL